MAEAAISLMSQFEFFTWQDKHAERYELVGGRPRLMTGATKRHDRLVVNALSAFATKLRGGPCRPMTDDIAVPTPGGNVRRPDLTVECGEFQDSDVQTSEPVLVLEVLSPSTVDVDRFVKLEEYKRLASLRHILIADAFKAHVLAYSRTDDGGWGSISHIGTDSTVPLPVLDCVLSLAELYEDVPLADLEP